MDNFKAVIFDMDGTMFDTEILQLRAWLDIGKKYNFNITEELVKSTFGVSRLKTKQIYLNALGNDFDFDYYRNIREEIVTMYIEQNGIPTKKRLVQLLNYLRDNGYAMGIATSSDRDKTYRYLDKAGVRNYFHTIITGDMISEGKPNPEIYLTAFEGLKKRFKNLQKSQCVVVEDAPSGIKAAKSSGMNVIMVPDLVQPTIEIENLLYAKCESLDDIKQILEAQKDIKIKQENQKIMRRLRN